MNTAKVLAHSGPFGMGYVPRSRIAQLCDDPHTLALIDFAADGEAAGAAGFVSHLPQLDGPPVCEYWRSDEPVARWQEGDFHLARTSEFMFARLSLPDTAAAERDAQIAYAGLLRILREGEFPHLVRVWNYFPRINEEESGRERYRSFCVGRAAALESLDVMDDARLPAASALGASGGGLQVYALAAREPGVQIENPRQISAFRYPNDYGPRSPSFSRATLMRWRDGTHFYISGTASIVGHASMHQSLEAQLGETLANVEAVVAQAHRVEGLEIRTPDALSLLKVYVRHAGDAGAVRDWLRARLGSAVPMAVVQADVCRAELLVEIEGAYCGSAG